MLAHECNPCLKMLVSRGLEVGRRQMQKLDAGFAQRSLVVTILGAKVDDGSDAVRRGKLCGLLHRKAAADRDIVRQPLEIRGPLLRHFSIFFFNIASSSSSSW
jgi:hypothetical protein